MVTHPSTNRSLHRVTLLMCRLPLLLCQATTNNNMTTYIALQCVIAMVLILLISALLSCSSESHCDHVLMFSSLYLFAVCWHCLTAAGAVAVFRWQRCSNIHAAGSVESFSEPFRWASFWWDSKWWAGWDSAETLSAASVVQSAACESHAWTAGMCYHCLSVRWMFALFWYIVSRCKYYSTLISVISSVTQLAVILETVKKYLL